MVFVEELIDAPLDSRQLAKRWQLLCADPSFEDLAAKIELTEWGEILMSPVGKTHGLMAAHIAELLRKAPASLPSGRTPSYVCPECGDVGCGAIAVRMTALAAR